MKQFVLRIILSVALLLLAAPAWADPITVTLTSGGGEFSGDNFEFSRFGGSSGAGYTIGLGDFAGGYSRGGDLALTFIAGMGGEGSSSMSTPTQHYAYQDFYFPGAGIDSMSPPQFTITTPGIPFDGVSHTVPFHVVIDAHTRPNGCCNDPTPIQDYEFLGDGLMTATARNPLEVVPGIYQYQWFASLTIADPVPEPSTWLLLLAGVGILLMARSSASCQRRS